MRREKLPIGIQTFRKIREDDYYYVDKTSFALRLIEEGSHHSSRARGIAVADRLSHLQRLAPNRCPQRIQPRLSEPGGRERSERRPAQGPEGRPSVAEDVVSRLCDVLLADDLDALRQHIDSLFAAIPHQWQDGSPIARDKGFYASVFFSHLAALGLDLAAEDASSHG